MFSDLTEADFPHFDYAPDTGVGFGCGKSRAPADHNGARVLIDLDTLAHIGSHPCCFRWDGEKVVRYRDEHPAPVVPEAGKSLQAQIDEAKAQLEPLKQQIGEMHLMIQQIYKKLGIAAAVVGLLVFPSIVRAQSFEIPPQRSTAYEANHVASGAKLYNMTISFHTAAYRTLMIFDAAAVPSDGGSQKPAICMEGISQASDPTESFKSISFVNNGTIFQTGIAITVSTSTSGCTTLVSDGSNDWFTIWAR